MDDKRRRTCHDVVAVLRVGDLDGSPASVCVVAVDDVIFFIFDNRTTVFDYDFGLLRGAVIGVVDKGSTPFQQLNSGRVHHLGVNGDGHRAYVRITVVGVALYLIIHGVLGGIHPGGNGFLIGSIRIIHRVNHRAAGRSARDHKLLVSVTKDQRVARPLRSSDDPGRFLGNRKFFCNRNRRKRIVPILLCGDGHGGVIAYIDIIAVRHRILVGRNCRSPASLCQRDHRLFRSAIVDKTILVKCNVR